MKFKFNFRLDKRRKLDTGGYPIKVNLHSYSEGRNFDFSIPDYFTSTGSVVKLVANNDNDFQKIWSKKDKINNFGEITGEEYVTGRRQEIRTVLKIKEDLLNEIIQRNEMITAGDVKNAFKRYKPKKVGSFDLITGFNNYIEDLKKQERFGYADGMKQTRNNFIKYLNPKINEERLFEILKQEEIDWSQVKSMSLYDITPDWLSEYERIRKKKTGMPAIINDAKYLRTIYNQAKKDNEILKLKYPFGKKTDDKYQIKTTTGKNQALELDEVQRILDFSSENYWYQMARDFWVFSYLGGGLNLKDIVFLTKDKYKKGFYIREKTKNTTNEVKKIKLSLIGEMPEIIERYKGSGKYLFDVVNDDDSPEVAYKKYKSRWSTIRDQLVKFREILKLPDSFGWQWARHSIGYIMSKSNISGFKIMDKLGHSDIKTTQNYIKSFDDDKEVEEEYLEAILPKKKGGENGNV